MIARKIEFIHCPTKTRTQIASEYEVSPRTLKRWMQKYNVDIPKGNITPKYQKIIYDKLGRPSS